MSSRSRKHHHRSSLFRSVSRMEDRLLRRVWADTPAQVVARDEVDNDLTKKV